MIRTVIHTNVLVSGLLSPSGTEALMILAIHQGLVRPCFTEAIVEEYSEVLSRQESDYEHQGCDAVAAADQPRRNGRFPTPS